MSQMTTPARAGSLPLNTSRFGTIVFAAIVGLGLVFVSGLAHSETLHDAAHDMRHATGYPCH
nr:CbtB-domain containing protein [Paracoccus sp. (in: a-proteobacteria)]